MFTICIDGPWITRSQLKSILVLSHCISSQTDHELYFGIFSCTLNRFILSVVERPTAIYYTLIGCHYIHESA